MISYLIEDKIGSLVKIKTCEEGLNVITRWILSNDENLGPFQKLK